MNWKIPAFILFLFAVGAFESEGLDSTVVRGSESSVLPVLTTTRSGRSGDPVNVGLVGGADEIITALVAAGWQPADDITVKSTLRFAKAVVLKKPDPDAPVSNLYLWGRHQDIAFEQEVNGSPRQRHHVRLWLSNITRDGRPLWVGASTYDCGIYLRKFSHHIAPDVDAERAYLFGTLSNANLLSGTTIVSGIGRTYCGHNSENDPYTTDGRIHIGWIEKSPQPDPCADSQRDYQDLLNKVSRNVASMSQPIVNMP